jgi:hypothetical protein
MLGGVVGTRGAKAAKYKNYALELYHSPGLTFPAVNSGLSEIMIGNVIRFKS